MNISKLALPILSLTLIGLAETSSAHAITSVTVYKSPTCGCCEKYVDYLRENGFAVKAINENNMDAIKKRHGVSHVDSCHTALVGGYVVEGHVPVGAIRKLLKETQIYSHRLPTNWVAER